MVSTQARVGLARRKVIKANSWLSFGEVGLSGCSLGKQHGRIAFAALLTKQVQEQDHGILLPLEMMDQNLPCRPNTPPPSCQARFPEQVWFDGHRIETGHVFGAVGSLDIKLVALGDHGDMIAWRSQIVQRVF